MYRLTRAWSFLSMRTASIAGGAKKATAFMHTTHRCAMHSSPAAYADSSYDSSRPRWTPSSFSRSRPSRRQPPHHQQQYQQFSDPKNAPPPVSQSRVGQRMDGTQGRPTFAVKRNSPSHHVPRSPTSSSAPHPPPPPPRSSTSRTVSDGSDFSEAEFEHHIQNAGRAKPPKRRNAWDNVTRLEEGGSEPGEFRRSASGNDQKPVRWNKSGRKSTHVPQPRNMRYTNRHEAPKRPHWLPDGVPYRLVAPSKEFEESWTNVLERYGAAPEKKIKK